MTGIIIFDSNTFIAIRGQLLVSSFVGSFDFPYLTNQINSPIPTDIKKPLVEMPVSALAVIYSTAKLAIVTIAAHRKDCHFILVELLIVYPFVNNHHHHLHNYLDCLTFYLNHELKYTP